VDDNYYFEYVKALERERLYRICRGTPVCVVNNCAHFSEDIFSSHAGNGVYTHTLVHSEVPSV
jgi:hypothetical protein